MVYSLGWCWVLELSQCKILVYLFINHHIQIIQSKAWFTKIVDIVVNYDYYTSHHVFNLLNVIIAKQNLKH